MRINIKNRVLDKIRDAFFGNRFVSYPENKLKTFVIQVSKNVARGSKILDAGAGESRHKKYFNHAYYISQDLCIGDIKWDFSEVDIKSEIYNLPIADNKLDYVLCTVVLEHLRYPDLAFKEFHRILRKDNIAGKLFLVSPLTFAEHQKPYDYFRYTQFALKSLGEENGFHVEKIEKCGGKFIVLSQIIIDIIPSFFIENNLLYIGYFFKVLLYPINFTIGFIFYFLDKLDRHKDLTLMYECIFTKK